LFVPRAVPDPPPFPAARVKIRILFALAACVLALPAQAQQGRYRDIGSFRYMPRIDAITDRDESQVSSRAAERLGGMPGSIAWICNGSGLLITITARDVPDRERLRMIYRFDRDRPDTLPINTWPSEGVLIVPRERQHAFTARARSANLLVVRLVHSRGESDRYFDLSGSNRALGMLACVRGLRPDEPPGATMPRPQDLLLPWEYEISAVEEAPILINREEVIQALERTYPTVERRAGIGGEVSLRLRVLASGEVDTAAITIESSTNPVFDGPARQVAATMRFSPARVNGRPVTVFVTVPVHFPTSRP
jgi:TonB family protein